MAAILVSGGPGVEVGAQEDATTTTRRPPGIGSTTSTTRPPLLTRPGRVAYVSPSGEVIVAESDGSSPKVVGTGAVKNRAGLAPLAWSPDGTRVAYVRNDRSLVLASADGSKADNVVANNAVVPPEASDNILSFLVTGTAISYIAEVEGGRTQAAVKWYDGPEKDRYSPLSEPLLRAPIAIQFSPLDPYLYLRSADVETGKEFTIAVVEPIAGEPVSTGFTVDDPVFAPDGAYLYGVTRGRGLDQLVRVDTTNAKFLSLRDQDRICKPMPSPDGKRLVYAAGPNCSEVWVIDSNGAAPKQVTSNVGGSASFADGDFSWSLDAETISHASCKGLEQGASCGGAYWDIKVDGSGVKARAQASSVRREYRPLIKAVKVGVELTGPLEYKGQLLISAESVGQLLSRPRDVIIDARGTDQQEGGRVFAAKLMIGSNNRFTTGTMRITDPTVDFDEQVMLIGSVIIQSYRYATLRGIWLKTGSMPFQSGRIDVTLYR
ncbi:MAG TPA: hypothetical protein VJM33_12200 [Microthrixaceae bacterium]|nr:hypothetical protein [Microthrixaceae bacterium]